MNKLKIYSLCTSFAILLLTAFAFQNCGTNFGDPNAGDSNISFSSFNPKGTTSAWLSPILPKAHAAVFDAHGCLSTITFMKYDPRWARIRANGSFDIDWDAVMSYPHREVNERVDFEEMITLDPNGTPLGVKEVPQGLFMRITINFYRFACEREYWDYHFSVSNDNGVFYNGPSFFEAPERKRSTDFFLNLKNGGLTIDNPDVKLEINVQQMVDYLNTVDSNGDIYGGIMLDGFIEVEE